MGIYIDLNRVKAGMPPSYDGSDDATLNTILNSCEVFLDSYTGRQPGGLNITDHDRVLHGSGTHQIYVPDAPITFIKAISTNKVPALFVRNNDSDTSTIATVSMDGVNLTLTYINALKGNQTVVIPLASYPSIQNLSDHVNTIGNFWQSGTMSGIQNRPTSDLWAPQGNFGCRLVTAYIWAFYQQLPTFWFDPQNSQGEIFSDMGFVRGVFNWRFQYTAGYQTFPEDLAQCLAELTMTTYYHRFINPNMMSESLGPYSYTRHISDPKIALPLSVT